MSVKPGYKMSKVGVIPEDWEVVTLKDITLSHNSGIYKKKEEYGSGVNIVGVSDLYGNISINGQLFRQVPLSEKEMKDFTLEEGDLIYGESSLVKSGIGKTLYVTENGAGTAFAWHTRRFKVNRDKTLSVFLNYLLNSQKYRDMLISVSTQTALTGITTKDFFKIKVPLPPLPEQKKIAEILSTVDSLIEKTDQVIAETEQLKKGLMQKLFSEGVPGKGGKPRECKDTKIGRVPEEWEVVRFSKYISLRHGYQFRDYDFVETGIPIIKIANLLDGGDIKLQDMTYIEKTREKDFNSFTLHQGDVLMALTGASLGKVSIIKNDYGLILQNYRVGLFKSDKNINNIFLYYILKSPFVFNRIWSLINESAQPNVGKGDFDKILIPLPPLPEQQKIAAILSTVDSKIDSEKQRKAHLEELKKGLMQKLLTGEVRVKV